MRENANKQSDQLRASSVPRDWAVIPLGKLLAHVIDFRGRTPLKLGMQWGGGEIPALSAMNVQMGCIDLSRETYYGSESLYRRWMTAGDPKPSDVLFTMEAPLGNVAQVLDAQRYIISQRVVLLRFNPSRMTNDFAAWQLRAADVQSQLVRWSTGTTATGIQRARLVHLPLRVPPLPEQRAIAAVLDTIDGAIQKTEQIIAKLQQVKQGLLHDLLTRGIDDNGELRDPERYPEQFQDSPLGRIPKGWEIVPFGALCESSAFGPRFPADRYSSSGALATLRTTDISDDGEIDLTTMPRAAIPPTVFSSHLLRPFDLVISRSGTCGIAAVFPGHSLAVVPGAFLIRFRLIRALSASFFRRYFNSQIGRPRLERLAVGGVQKNIKGSDVLSLLVPSPSDNEQDAIIAAIESVGNTEQREAEDLVKLRVLKAGLSDDLLTGRVRTTSLLGVAA